MLAIVGALLALTGCGVVYTAPSVHDGSVFGEPGGTDFDVQIVRMTPETTIAANLETYVPPRLPLAFQPDAAARAAKGVSAGRVDPIPAPATPQVSRPNFVPERFPPLGEPSPYRIGVGDVVLLAINPSTATLDDLPDLITAQSKRQGFIVQDDGAVAVPDAGRVRISGLTLQEAEREIFQALISAGIDPQFTLEIAEFNSQRVSVGGEVRNPALVPLGLKPLFLHEAVQIAGGTAVVDPMIARVQLIRGGQTYAIGLERFQTDPAARRIVLQDGDSVFVGSEFREEAAQRAFQERLSIRSAQIQSQQFELQRAQLEAQRLSNAQSSLEADRQLFKDRLELGAVERLLGDHAANVTMSSTKSATGHLLGAAGAIEAIFSILAIRDQVCPPTINLDTPAVETPVDLAPNAKRERTVNYALSNSFGFGGTN
ncbi:MAG: polysaccharide biosynthesis/export family protein, partial [Pseudomonadota bacterium]